MTRLDRPVRLVSFDLDDTLLDTWRAVPPRVRAALRLHPANAALSSAAVERIAAYVAAGDDDRAERLLRGAGTPPGTVDATTLLEAYAAQETLIAPMDDAHAVLARLQREFPVVVITNNDRASAVRRLQMHGLDRLIAAVVTPTDLGISKPDPRMFIHAAERAGVPPEACVHIGDSLVIDVHGANEAGWASVWLRSEAPHHEPMPQPPPVPTATIDRLSELPALLGLD